MSTRTLTSVEVDNDRLTLTWEPGGDERIGRNGRTDAAWVELLDLWCGRIEAGLYTEPLPTLAFAPLPVPAELVERLRAARAAPTAGLYGEAADMIEALAALPDADVREELRRVRLTLDGTRLELRDRVSGDAAYNRRIAALEEALAAAQAPPAPPTPFAPTPGSFAIGEARGATQEPRA